MGGDAAGEFGDVALLVRRAGERAPDVCCARSCALMPNSPAPNIAAFWKKLLRVPLISSPRYLRNGYARAKAPAIFCVRCVFSETTNEWMRSDSQDGWLDGRACDTAFAVSARIARAAHLNVNGLGRDEIRRRAHGGNLLHSFWRV